jgi:hypothetical protein
VTDFQEYLRLRSELMEALLLKLIVEEARDCSSSSSDKSDLDLRDDRSLRTVLSEDFSLPSEACSLRSEALSLCSDAFSLCSEVFAFLGSASDPIETVFFEMTLV